MRVLAVRPAPPPEIAIAAKLSDIIQVLFGSAVVWLLACYANLRPTWVPKAVAACGAVVILLHLSLPVLLSSGAASDFLLRAERTGHPGRATGPGPFSTNVFEFLVLTCVVWTCVYLWCRKAKSKAIWVTLGAAPLVFVAPLHGLMVNWAILLPSVLDSFASVTF